MSYVNIYVQIGLYCAELFLFFIIY